MTDRCATVECVEGGERKGAGGGGELSSESQFKIKLSQCQ